MHIPTRSVADFVAGRGGLVLSAGIFLLVLVLTARADRQQLSGFEAERRESASRAERRASHLGDHLGNVMSSRMGALAAAKLQRVPEDEFREAVLAAGDSATHHMPGLVAVSFISPDGEILRGAGAALGRWGLLPSTDPRLQAALRRSIDTKEPAATDVLDLPVGRRFFIFDPIAMGDTAAAGVLAAELDPASLFLMALTESGADTLPNVFYELYSPSGLLLTSFPAPADWPTVSAEVRVADLAWSLHYPFPPLSVATLQAYRLATWATGLAIAFFLPGMLLFLRRTIGVQRGEIELRLRAEERVRDHAQQAMELARKARELALQLEAAQAAAQRVSTSLDVDDVLEIFLGSVGERLGADVAAVYTFDDEGEVVVGRKRVVLREDPSIPAELRSEEIEDVRAPVALLPVMAEAVTSGRTHIEHRSRPVGARNAGTAPAAAAIPLLVGGHMVGVALWESYGSEYTFDPDRIAFAEALAASAASALRTAELFRSLETAKEQATREALRFATVLDQMADAVVVVNGRGQVELSNPAAEALLGHEATRAPLTAWDHLVPIAGPDGRLLPISESPLSRALAGERIDRAIFTIRRPKGEERRIAASAAPLRSAHGNRTGAALVFRDVTDEHQYAELLLHKNRELLQQATMLEEMNERLRDATAAKDRFLAVMSHELRTPLNAVLGYSDLLEMGVKGELTPEQKSMVARIRHTSGHLLGLITDVLDLAKIGAGRMDLVLTDLDVHQLLRESVEQVVPQATAKRLELRVAPSADGGDRPVTALADETRLRQIMLNLLSNAVKFTDRGSIEVIHARTASLIEIRVRDSGPGIPADQLERIFEEFFQLDSGYDRNRGGTGLGLAISWRLARLMGGDLRVESEVGKGSEFTVTLPAVEPTAGGSDGATPTVAVLSADAKLIARLARSLAGRARAIGASDPATLGALVRRQNATVVALDALAADCAAWRALRAMQDAEAPASGPVVFLVKSAEGVDHYLDLGPILPRATPLDVEEALAAAGRLASGADTITNVAIVDASPERRRSLRAALESAGYEVEDTATAEAALALLAERRPEVLLADLLLEGNGLAMLLALRTDPALRDLVVVGLLPPELGVEEMRRLDAAVQSLRRAPEPPADDIVHLVADVLRRLLPAPQREHKRPGGTVPA